MIPSDAAVRLIKSFEVNYQGVVALQAYDDGYGNWTIGWGRVRGVRAGDTINLANAELYLQEDIGIAARAVDASLKVPLAQHEYDALVVLSFNCRRAVKATSSLMAAINAGKGEQVPALWMQYQYARNLQTNVLTASRGLVRRRRAELELWRGLTEPDREQAVAIAPGSVTNARPGAVYAALKDSWTIRGIVLAALGWIGQALEWSFGFFRDAAAQIATLKSNVDPILQVWGGLAGRVPDLLVGLTVSGLGVAVWQRIKAAREGKIG